MTKEHSTITSETENTNSNNSQEKPVKKKKQKFRLNGNDYIQNALEKSLVDIQYWENWREMLGRLSYDLSYHGHKQEKLQEAIDTIYSAIYGKENEAWKHSFMWSLGQSENTRKKILQKAKEKFLISDRDHVSFEIMSHLDPRFLLDSKANENEFREAIRHYFELEPQKEEEKEDEAVS